MVAIAERFRKGWLAGDPRDIMVARCPRIPPVRPPVIFDLKNLDSIKRAGQAARRRTLTIRSQVCKGCRIDCMLRELDSRR